MARWPVRPPSTQFSLRDTMIQVPHLSDTQRADCARYLQQLFGGLDAGQIDGILAEVGLQMLRAADNLFLQGDAPGAFYVVLSGRLRAIVTGPDGDQTVLGDIAAGEPVGEIAVFTKEPRMASVVALRPSLLLRITEENYLGLIRRFPSLALALNQFFIRRLRQNNAPPRALAAPRNVAVINLCERRDTAVLTARAVEQFAAMGTPAHVVGRPAKAADLDDALSFDAVERQGGLNLLLCDPVADAWTRSCLIYADLVVVLVDFHSDPGLRPVERELELHAKQILGKRIYLLLLHESGSPPPAETSRWLQPRRVHLHLHLREGHLPDLRRFCRILTNRAVGLVLSGGGAKGFAHLGAVQAMREAGVEFDFVGGTSAGALFGAAMSLHDFDWESLRRLFGVLSRSAPTSYDYTWPFLSLLSGRKMRAALTKIFGEYQIEDLWTTFYCVSSNYSTATLAVHERGPLRRQVEASIAVPGVFPPVLLNGQLHLDGGLFDNLPILTMLERPVGPIAAVSLETHSPHSLTLTELPSPWRMLWTRKRRELGLPSLPTLLINALALNSKHQLASSRGQADLFVRVDLQGFGLLDWRRWQESYHAGYEQTRAALAAQPPERRFWRGT